MGTVESRVKQRTKCERVDYGVGVQLYHFWVADVCNRLSKCVRCAHGQRETRRQGAWMRVVWRVGDHPCARKHVAVVTTRRGTGSSVPTPCPTPPTFVARGVTAQQRYHVEAHTRRAVAVWRWWQESTVLNTLVCEPDSAGHELLCGEPIFRNVPAHAGGTETRAAEYEVWANGSERSDSDLQRPLSHTHSLSPCPFQPKHIRNHPAGRALENHVAIREIER